MQRTKQAIRFLYDHKFIRYVFVGGTTFVLDFALLVLLHGVLELNVIIAASLSYWIAIAFNFMANRFWTFAATDANIIKHLAAYLMLLSFNYLFTVTYIGVMTDLSMHYTIAKITAVAIQISWTYVIYKKIIFV